MFVVNSLLFFTFKKKTKMKKTTKLITFLISLIVLLSCSKEDISINKVNQENPLENIGIEHNRFMLEFTNHLEKSYESEEWDNIEFLSVDHKKKFSEIMNVTFNNLYPESGSTIELQMEIYDKLDLNEWYDGDNRTGLDIAKEVLVGNLASDIIKAKNVLKKNTTSKDAEYTINFLEEIYTVASKNLSTKQETFDEINKVVKKHENLILSESWLPQETYALGSLAIGKYSSEFWNNYDYSHYANKSNNKTSLKKKLEDPGDGWIVAADVAGYVIGGAIGAVIGIEITIFSVGIALPVGLTAFIAGKLIGSFMASSAALTAQAIFNAWSDYLGL